MGRSQRSKVEIHGSLYGTPDGSAWVPDTEPEPPPAPVLTAIDPATAVAGDPDTTVTCTGTDFVDTSVVSADGAPLVTTFSDATSLTAVLPAASLAAAATIQISVDDGTALPFEVTAVVEEEPGAETTGTKKKR